MTIEPGDLVVLAILWVGEPYRLEVTPMEAAACEARWRQLQERHDIVSECMPMSWWLAQPERRKP